LDRRRPRIARHARARRRARRRCHSRPRGAERVAGLRTASAQAGEAMTIRVLLAEDQAIVRAGFRALLDAEADLEVAGEAADGREAVSLAHELHPDLVLMDIRMPELDGLEATRQITADPTLRETRVLVLTTFELD